MGDILFGLSVRIQLPTPFRVPTLLPDRSDFINRSPTIVFPTSLAIFIKMVKRVYETFRPDQVTDDMLGKAATLFNENYGTWGPQSHKPGK